MIANLVSDGAAAWTASSASRFKVLDRMVLAINSWPLSQKRNINYRSATAVRLAGAALRGYRGAKAPPPSPVGAFIGFSSGMMAKEEKGV